MACAGRSAVAADAALAGDRQMAELLGRDDLVARVTQVARVAVDVEPAEGQGRCVVDDVGRRGAAMLEASFAQAVRAAQAAQALALASSAAQALGSHASLTVNALR
jgi:hypothetical protein